VNFRRLEIAPKLPAPVIPLVTVKLQTQQRPACRDHRGYPVAVVVVMTTSVRVGGGAHICDLDLQLHALDKPTSQAVFNLGAEILLVNQSSVLAT